MDTPAPSPDLSIPIIPQTLGTPEPPVPPPEPQAPTADDRLSALEAQLAAQREQNAQLLAAIAQRPMVAPQPVAPAAPALQPFSLDGIPDPVQAPTDFTRQLTERIRQREQQLGQYITQNVTQQVARGAALDSLYNRFNVQQPELAKRSALLQGAASVVFNQLRAQGIDPTDVAAQNPDSLIASIAQRMTQELGGVVAPSTPTPPAPGFVPHGAPMLPTSPPTGAASPARTAGIAAGSATPRVPTPPAPPPGFVSQLLAARAKDGL